MRVTIIGQIIDARSLVLLNPGPIRQRDVKYEFISNVMAHRL